MTRRAAVLALALTAGCAGGGGPTTMGKMVSPDEIATALRGVPDDALLSAGKAELLKRAYAALDRKDFDGLAIRVPSRVDDAKRQDLPALVAVGQTEERERKVPLDRNGALVITRLGVGGCWIARPYDPPPGKNPMRNPPKPSAPAPEEDVSDARGLGVAVVDARGGMPWEPGRFRFQVIAAEWASNAEIVTLGDGGKPVADKVKLRADFTYSKSADSPELKGAGAALRQAGKTSYFHGSVRLKRDPGWPQAEDGRTAIPCVLLIKWFNDVTPNLVEFHVPASGSGDEVEAWFSVDLRALAPRPFTEPYKSWVYLIAGEHFGGPVELAK